MSDQNRQNIDASGTAAHASNPFVASYDIVDFMTTLAFVTSNLASTAGPVFPMISNILHLVNYSLLGYIQARDMNQLQLQEIEELQNREGTIHNNEEYQAVRNELLPPKKDGKTAGEYAWDYAIYVLKLMTCAFLITLSLVSTAAVSGAVAAFVNGALFPIAYVATCAINTLKFGQNFIKGLYDYFKKDTDGNSTYTAYHKTVDAFERKYKLNTKHPHEIPGDELQAYLDARNAINKTGRDNIQNGIFFGLSASFLAGSLMFLLASSALFTAVIPPVGITIGGAIFAGVGFLFAAHGISVLRNAIRKKRGLPEKKTFFGWITDKFYPEVTPNKVAKQGLNFSVGPATEENNMETFEIAASNVEEGLAHTLDATPEENMIAVEKEEKSAPLPTSSLLTSYGTVGFFSKQVQETIKNTKEHTPTLVETGQQMLDRIDNSIASVRL